MATKIIEFTFAGRSCKAAPAPFSEDVCELITLFEETAEINEQNEGKAKDDKTRVRFKKNGRLVTLIRRVGKGCLLKAGHTEEEAEEILNSIELAEDTENGIPEFVSALGLN